MLNRVFDIGENEEDKMISGLPQKVITQPYTC